MTISEKFYKNINQLYLNNFDIPEFNNLKNYRLKLMNDDNYVNDLLIYLNMKDNYINDINILIDRLDILIYCILVLKLIKNPKYKDELYGLIFAYSSNLNNEINNKNVKVENSIIKNISKADKNVKVENSTTKNIKTIKSKIRQYEPNDLTLFKKYNIFKIFDYLNNDFDLSNENELINLITDFQDFRAKIKDIDDITLKIKFHNYYVNKFK